MGMNNSNSSGNGSNGKMWIHRLRKKSTSCPPNTVVTSKDNETSKLVANSREINSRRFSSSATTDDLERVEEGKEMIDGKNSLSMDSQFRRAVSDECQSPTLLLHTQTNKDHHLPKEEDVFLLATDLHHPHNLSDHSMTSHQPNSPETLSHSMAGKSSAANQSSKQRAEEAESTVNRQQIQPQSDELQKHSKGKLSTHRTAFWRAF